MILLLALAAATPAPALPAPSQAQLKSTVATLVGFGTRHTLSTTTDPKRGIGAARNWVAGQFERIGRDCGGCVKVERISRRVVGARAPAGVVIEDVLGIQPGRDPDRVVIVGGHIDSRVTDVMDVTSDAPGANDDASGVAVVLEAARLLSKRTYDATIVYAVFSGEEQGLYGGALLADTAKARGWQVTAMLNNDIVGNSTGQGGVKDTGRVRVFSEGIRASEDLPEQMRRRADGGEDDGPSRALAKAIDHVAATIPGQTGPGGFDVVLDQRPDRFGRGGDHEPFLKLGYPAVRFSVGAEDWDAQHQDLRTENGVVYGDTIDKMDFDYLAHVAAINIATIDRLADAPAAPAEVGLVGDLSRDTKVSWEVVPGAVAYRVHWRTNDGTGDWTHASDVTGTSTVLKQTPVDDHFIGVSALGADGAESLVTFGGRAARR